MRQVLQGMYLPRDDLLGWRVEIGQDSYTNDNPGPISQVDVELDAVGCLTSGSIALKRPRHPVFPAYRFTALLSLLSKTRGWVEVGTGYIPPAKEDGREEWSLELRPREELAMNGYFDGSLLGGHNTLGSEIGDWKETNEAVVSRILQRNPTAMLGTHADGTVVLARPEDGTPVNISQARFYEWKSTGLVTLPYGTESRWDGGPGWRKGEYHGISRPPLIPRKVVDAGEVEFQEVTRSSGPSLVREEELIIGEAPGPVASAGAAVAGQNGLIKRTVTADQYAYVRVYDLEAWFEGSALAGQDNDLIKQLKEQLATAQGAYQLAHDTLGEGDHLTVLEQRQMQAAETQIRVARWGQGSVQSDYEPLSAKLSLGFVLEGFRTAQDQLQNGARWGFLAEGDGLHAQVEQQQLVAVSGSSTDPPSLLTGTTMWISRNAWDEQAIGVQTGQDADPDASDLIHPLLSQDTIKVFDTPLVELDEQSRNTPFQQGSLTIPPDYFRGPMGPALVSLMDKQWKESFDPEEPPDDAVPPSRTWDGKWYFYLASWWRVAATAAVFPSD